MTKATNNMDTDTIIACLSEAARDCIPLLFQNKAQEMLARTQSYIDRGVDLAALDEMLASANPPGTLDALNTLQKLPEVETALQCDEAEAKQYIGRFLFNQIVVLYMQDRLLNQGKDFMALRMKQEAGLALQESVRQLTRLDPEQVKYFIRQFDAKFDAVAARYQGQSEALGR